MIFTIIVMAKIGVPVRVDSDSLQSAVDQAGKVLLDNFVPRDVSIELSPVAEWIIREEAAQTTIEHMDQALRGLLDLYTTIGNKIFEEPAVINALAVLQEVPVINARINDVQRWQNERSAISGDSNQVRTGEGVRVETD